MLPDLVFLLSVILVAAFVVIQLGKTRRGGVIPLVAGIGAAGFSYSRYSQLSGSLGQLGGTFDTHVTYLQYFWIGSMLLWMVIASWGLVRVLSSAHLSGVARGLWERVRAVTAPPTADVNMERGIIPTLKGAGAGALGGGLIAGLPLVLPSAGSRGEGAAWGMLFALAAAAGGAIVGAVAGGVTANTTTSKGKGASLGARVGAATGAIGMVALSMKPGNFFDVSLLVAAAALGAMAGAAAGFLGSVVAKHERGVALSPTGDEGRSSNAGPTEDDKRQ